MWPTGHLAIAYLCYSASTRQRFDGSPEAMAVLVVGFGGLFPDLVDKPLAWYLSVLPTGRSLGHSLLFLVSLTAVLFLMTRSRGRGEYSVAFGIGAISHTLLDAVPALWGAGDWEQLFWPLLPIQGYEGSAPTILGLLRDSLASPYFVVEFLLVGVALLIWRVDGYPGVELLPGLDSAKQ